MKLSVVIPLYNEQDNLRPLFQRLKTVFETLDCRYEIIFVDDGSRDASPQVLRELAKESPVVRVITLSRNFGHEAASTAGLDSADGDAVILMDADLQDPPEVIPKMVEKWKSGYHVVYARRRRRAGESRSRILLSSLFYRMINRLIDVKFPLDVGDFRLIDRQVVRALGQCREQNRFVRGLVAWVGFRQVGITYDRKARYSGTTKYNMAKLIMLTADAVSAFSIIPLRAAIFAGFITTAGSFIISSIVILQKLKKQLHIPGYALTTAGQFLLGGIQLIVMGVLGEYVGRSTSMCRGARSISCSMIQP